MCEHLKSILHLNPEDESGDHITLEMLSAWQFETGGHYNILHEGHLFLVLYNKDDKQLRRLTLSGDIFSVYNHLHGEVKESVAG